jgi:hypothetical protein
VAENRLGSSTRDWRLSLDSRPEAVSRDWRLSLDSRPEAGPRDQEEEEEEDVYEDLAVFSSYAKPREDVSSYTVKKGSRFFRPQPGGGKSLTRLSLDGNN